MKKLLICILSILYLNNIYAAKKSDFKMPGDTLPVVYLGIGTGVNNYCGMLGVGIDIKCIDRLFLRVGGGIGSWGYKITGGIKHERKHKKGWTFSALYSLNTGLKNFKFKLETVSGQVPVTKEVTLDLLQATCITLSTGYNWVFKKKNKFFLEFGYSVPIEAEPYKVTDGSVLTDNSKNALKFSQPGGIVFGLGLLFGL